MTIKSTTADAVARAAQARHRGSASVISELSRCDGEAGEAGEASEASLPVSKN